jgi:hypothetical protein
MNAQPSEKTELQAHAQDADLAFYDTFVKLSKGGAVALAALATQRYLGGAINGQTFGIVLAGSSGLMGAAVGISELVRRWPNGIFAANEEIKLPSAEELANAKAETATERAAAIADTQEIEARLGGDEPSMKR